MEIRMLGNQQIKIDGRVVNVLDWRIHYLISKARQSQEIMAVAPDFFSIDGRQYGPYQVCVRPAMQNKPLTLNEFIKLLPGLVSID